MISVIVPSYNSEATIKQCLDSLKNQSYMGDYEVILVDSSIDKTPQIVASEYSKVKLIHLQQKTDPGSARNIGIKEAKGDLIAFIDSDCLAKNDWLEKIAISHNSLYNVAGGSVNIANRDDDLVGYAGYIAEFREFLPELPKRELKHIPTCNISYKKNIFDKFGMFRGEYYPQEDLVYNYNLRSSGERIIFDPSIQVYHYHRSGLKDFLRHQHMIGITTSKVLKTIDLGGSFIARNKLILTLAILFLPTVKFFRTIYDFIKYQPKTIIKRPLVLLLFALGLAYWVIGFARSAYTNNSFIKREEEKG